MNGFQTAIQNAIQAEKRRDFIAAERFCTQALALSPDAPEALYFLGIIHYRQGKFREAYHFVEKAVVLTGWKNTIWQSALNHILFNFFGQRLAEEGLKFETLCEAYKNWLNNKSVSSEINCPLIAVIVPCFNHERYIAEALRSVFNQTYKKIEIIAIDDGSTDNSPYILKDTLARQSPFSYHFLAQENHGAAAAINAAVAMTKASYISILNSDDAFFEDRLAMMVNLVAGKGAAWGFSEVECVDENGELIDILRNERAFFIKRSVGASRLDQSVGLSLLGDNIAVSTGNLFFSRDLFDKIGGFRNYRYVHDWDFCLRSLRFAEPVFLRKPLYRYRLHQSNTITESSQKSRVEADFVVSQYMEWAIGDNDSISPFAPSFNNWGVRFLFGALGVNVFKRLSPDQRQEIVRHIRYGREY